MTIPEHHLGLDLDTADSVFQDIDSNLLPWMRMVHMMQLYISSAEAAGLDHEDLSDSDYLLRRIVRFVEANSKVVNDRLTKDTYRSNR